MDRLQVEVHKKTLVIQIPEGKLGFFIYENKPIAWLVVPAKPNDRPRLLHRLPNKQLTSGGIKQLKKFMDDIKIEHTDMVDNIDIYQVICSVCGFVLLPNVTATFPVNDCAIAGWGYLCFAELGLHFLFNNTLVATVQGCREYYFNVDDYNVTRFCNSINGGMHRLKPTKLDQNLAVYTLLKETHSNI